MNFLSAKYNVAARYVNYIYEYRRMNASCTVKCHCRGGGRRGGVGGGGGGWKKRGWGPRNDALTT